MQIFKRIFCLCLCAALVMPCAEVFAEVSVQVDTDVSAQLVSAPSALLMEASSGQILYELNAHERMPIASVTKTMTMLLIMEAIDSGKISLGDMVTVSEYAASMGGSQVFLEQGEQMSVDDMLKSIAVASGNDAAVAMAEFVSGTEETFVEQMNKKAAQLGANDTHFINCNGLDETEEHYSSAYDVALISCELLKHEKIQDYLTIWMDSIRGGEFQLANTNKLIRFYDGANGIKTGSTSTAKYCLSAAAKRNNMQLVAVVLAAPTTAERFSSATKLLDYGFANYSVVDDSIMTEPIPQIRVNGGSSEFADTKVEGGVNFIVKKGNGGSVEVNVQMDESVDAPAAAGTKVGEVIFTIDGGEVARRNIVTQSDAPKITYFQMFGKILKKWTFVR